MNIDEIIERHNALEAELHEALATMELNDKVRQVQKKLHALQNECPHTSAKYNLQPKNNHCPYCGKRVG
jgi:hypothetical protein